MHRLRSRFVKGVIIASSGIALLTGVYYVNKKHRLLKLEERKQLMLEHNKLTPGFSKFVKRYAPLSYDADGVEKERLRIASGCSQNAQKRFLEIPLDARNRQFDLVLNQISPEFSPFASDLTVDVDGVKYDIQPHDFLYEGYAKGDPKSRVYGSLFDGVFDGNIHLSDGSSYTVDKTAKYFGLNERPNFHSRLYHDIKGFALRKRTPMETKIKNVQGTDSTVSERASRKVKTCTMYLKADHTLYQEILSKEGNGDPKRTLQEIMSILYTHVKAANEIFERTQFDGNQGIRFAVKRISIQTPSACTNETGTTKHSLCEELTESNFLLALSKQADYSPYCLAFAVTYREFDGLCGGVSLAANSEAKLLDKFLRYTGLQPGVCGAFQPYEGISLNTGAITLQSNGTRMPGRKSQLILTHELAHSVGAGHDDQGEKIENLMFPVFNPCAAIESHHVKFSEKSIRDMSEVLDYVQRQEPYDPAKAHEDTWFRRKRNCLQ